jgi:hypothetical protein
MKTVIHKKTSNRKSGNGRPTFSIFNFPFSIRIRIGKAFLVFSFYLLSLTAAGQTITIQPVEHASTTFVVMGDSLKFEVQLTNSHPTNPVTGELEITLPAGFKLLSTNIVPGTLATDGLSGKIDVTVPANLVVGKATFYIKPLCDAEDAVADHTLRKIGYKFGSVTKETEPIINIYKPILDVKYPAGTIVSINKITERVIPVRQNEFFAYVNNIKIDVTADTSVLSVSKIEVSRDSLFWVDISNTGFDTIPTGYRYNLSLDNTFKPLAYPDDKMKGSNKLYIRETVALKKCANGTAAYAVAFGDGDDFCLSPEGAGNISLSVNNPTYGADIISSPTAGFMTWPTSPTNDGIWRVRIINTATDPDAIMHDVYLTIGTHVQYIMKKAYICDANGAPIPDNDGNTIWLDMIPGLGAPRADFNLSSTDHATQAIYESIGFTDDNGDGIYNDLKPGKSVYVAYLFNISQAHLSTSSCLHSEFVSGAHTVGWGYYKVCDEDVQFGRSYSAGGASFWIGAVLTRELRSPVLTPSFLNVGDKATLSFMRDDYPGSNFLEEQHGASGTSIYYTEITLPEGLDFDESAAVPVVLKDVNGDAYPVTAENPYGGNLTMLSGLIQKMGDNQHIRVQLLPALNGTGTYLEIAVVANNTPNPSKTFSSINLFDYGKTGDLYQFGCHTSSVDYIIADNCDDIEMMDVSVERTTFGYTDTTKTTRMTKAMGANVHVIYPFDSVKIYANMAVRGASAITGTDVLKVSTSYRSNNHNVFINRADDAQAGRLLFYKGTTLHSTFDIPAAYIK